MESKDKDKLTPEERLLKVMDTDGEPAEEKPAPSPFHWKGFGAREKLSQWTSKFSRFKNGRSFHLSLTAVNRILMLAIVLGLVSAAVNTFAFKQDLNWVFKKVANVNVPGEEATEIPNLKPFEEYLAVINKRNLFTPPGATPAAALPSIEGASLPATTDAAKMLDDLQLVGIAWGTYPEAMIRDKKENRTHFLKEDQQFKGIRIKQILKDRVIVEYGGLQKELL